MKEGVGWIVQLLFIFRGYSAPVWKCSDGIILEPSGVLNLNLSLWRSKFSLEVAFDVGWGICMKNSLCLVRGVLKLQVFAPFLLMYACIKMHAVLRVK